MIEQRSLFFTYRYMVSASPKTLFSDIFVQSENKSKEDLMTDIILDLYNAGKTPFKFGKKRYIIFAVKSYKKRTFLFNFAKEEKGVKYVEGENSIEISEDNRLKHVLIYVNLERQILFIERKSTAFQDIDTVVNTINWYLNDRIKHFDYTTKIYPISNPNKFWQAVETADAIYELSLTFNAPNLFGGNREIKDLINEIKNETNNDQTTLDFRSKEGNLIVEKSFWEAPIEYLSRIAGKYSIIYKKNGERRRHSNSDADNIEKTDIVRHKNAEYTDDEMGNVEKKMEIIDVRSKDKNDDETQ